MKYTESDQVRQSIVWRDSNAGLSRSDDGDNAPPTFLNIGIQCAVNLDGNLSEFAG